MSEIRVTSVVGENGGDRVGLTTGLTVGPLTGTTGIGATITHQGHAQFAGVCTATSFVGNVTTDKIIPTGGVPSGGGGGIIQVVSTTITTPSSAISVGASYATITALNTTITPKASGSKILVSLMMMGEGNSTDDHFQFGMVRSVGGGSDTPCLVGDAAGSRRRIISQPGANTHTNHDSTPSFFSVPNALDSPSYTLGQSIVYKLQVATNAGSTKTWYYNRTVTDSDTNDFERGITYITLMEISG